MDELGQAAHLDHSDLHTCTTDDNTISAVSEKILRPRRSRLRPAPHQADRSRSARRRQVRWFETKRPAPPRTPSGPRECSVSLRADAADALERGTEREGAAVADLVGHGADR